MEILTATITLPYLGNILLRFCGAPGIVGTQNDMSLRITSSNK